MSPKLIAALNKQANYELQASQSYLAMAYWCEVHHSSGFAKFFHEQAAEEQTHAAKLMKHLADRDVVPAIGALAAPKVSFKQITDVAQAVWEMERANTTGIHATYETALAEKDYPAQVPAPLVHQRAGGGGSLVRQTPGENPRGHLRRLAHLTLDRHLSKILSSDSEAD